MIDIMILVVIVVMAAVHRRRSRDYCHAIDSKHVSVLKKARTLTVFSTTER